MLLQVGEHRAESALVIRECPVVELLAGAVESDRVMLAFPDVETDEHVDLVVVRNLGDHCSSVSLGLTAATVRLGIHVTNDLERARAWPLSAITHRQPGSVTTPPGSSRTGGTNHAEPGRLPPPSMLTERLQRK